MSSFPKKYFSRSVKGKVVFAFLGGCLAFILVWAITLVAFREMLDTVNELSEPNEKLQIVNELFRGAIRIDRLQGKMQTGPDDLKSYKVYLNESKEIQMRLDTLQKLYRGNRAQVARIDSVKRLLNEKNNLLGYYLAVHKGLVNNKTFINRLQSLAEILGSNSAIKDSAIVTTQKQTTTTTILAADTTKNKSRLSVKDILASIFDKKKTRNTRQQLRKTVKEEINTTTDTLYHFGQDSLITDVEAAVQNIGKEQRKKQSAYIKQASALSEAGRRLVNKMLGVLQDVNREVVNQAYLTNIRTQKAANIALMRFTITAFVFFMMLLALVFLIIKQINRNNKYQIELAEAKEEAEYHSLAKQRFLANMSHEIRTPLQSIIGFSEILWQKDNSNTNEVDAIYQSSNHLLHIVNEVLDYSRVISGKFTFEKVDFDIKNLTEDVVAVMRQMAEKKSLELILESDVQVSSLVSGDAFRLRQILYNILGNAIKFTETGSVRLTVLLEELQAADLLFTCIITDTGPGISGEDIKHVFNEFERTGHENQNQSEGTGLGLSIVKALVEGQGGEIEVSSVSTQGTCFKVRLPFEKALSFKQQVLPLREQPIYGKVCIVDDDDLILELCSAILTKHGIPHSCFSSGESTLNACWDFEIDLVLMDIRMPGMSGTELCQVLKKRTNGHTKIVALTAQAMPEERRAILEQGFDGLLIKPFRETDILNLLYEKTDSNYQVAQENSYGIDFSAVYNMAFGDTGQVNKFLKQFVKDTRTDLKLLKEAANAPDIERFTLVLHRIAGRTAQIGAKELALQFRELEILTRESGLKNFWDNRLDEIEENMNQLVELIEQTLSTQFDTSLSYYKAFSDQY